MKRDDLLLTPDSTPSDQTLRRVERRPMYFDTHADGGKRAFFGWHHSAPSATPRDCVAVVCGPIGYEYTRAHRSMRHLADRLARQGFPAIRFDYHGIGDSPGSDMDPDRLNAWQANIKTAICRAREMSGRTHVCLIGVRLGATLAAMVASEIRVDSLVLWNPCVTGRPYLRELQAIALTAALATENPDGAIESGGFVMSAETIASLRRINLLERRLQADRVLLLERDDHPADASLQDHIAAMGIACERIGAPGWEGMVAADHHLTVVPEEALALIVDWMTMHSEAVCGGPLPVSSLESSDEIAFDFRDEAGNAVALEERAVRFGTDAHLFGVMSHRRGEREGARDLPVVVFLNAGAVHHVGPNRLYVNLARRLGAAGFHCLRFDVESLGDSVRRSPGKENESYPENALTDVRTALKFLRRQLGYRRFIVTGLCSGAHNSFHAGLEFAETPIDEVILINPLTFYWVEGMDFATSRSFEDMVQYRKSLRDPNRWLKLLRGRIDFRRLFEVTLTQARAKARSSYESFRELLVPESGPRLSRDLKRLFAMNRRMTLFVAEGDPGRDILMAGARRTASKALESGAIRVHMIANADHTFSQAKPRRELAERLQAHLECYLAR